jgi:hypothetical protein
MHLSHLLLDSYTKKPESACGCEGDDDSRIEARAMENQREILIVFGVGLTHHKPSRSSWWKFYSRKTARSVSYQLKTTKKGEETKGKNRAVK